jgi:hypothetical protein
LKKFLKFSSSKFSKLTLKGKWHLHHGWRNFPNSALCEKVCRREEYLLNATLFVVCTSDSHADMLPHTARARGGLVEDLCARGACLWDFCARRFLSVRGRARTF